MLKSSSGALILVLALFALLSAAPAGAANLAAPAAAPVAAQPGCQPVLDLGKVLQTQGETCPANAAPQAKTPEPEFLIATGRTCRCSCGYPCKTDADCGGGVGSCRPGISCC